MMAAANGRPEVCLKLAALAADLNLKDRVSDSSSNFISVCRCMIIILAFLFELVRKDGLDVGC